MLPSTPPVSVCWMNRRCSPASETLGWALRELGGLGVPAGVQLGWASSAEEQWLPGAGNGAGISRSCYPPSPPFSFDPAQPGARVQQTSAQSRKGQRDHRSRGTHSAPLQTPLTCSLRSDSIRSPWGCQRRTGPQPGARRAQAHRVQPPERRGRPFLGSISWLCLKLRAGWRAQRRS